MNLCACGCGRPPKSAKSYFHSGDDLIVAHALVRYLTSMTVTSLAKSRPDLIAAAMDYKEKHQ